MLILSTLGGSLGTGGHGAPCVPCEGPAWPRPPYTPPRHSAQACLLQLCLLGGGSWHSGEGLDPVPTKGLLSVTARAAGRVWTDGCSWDLFEATVIAINTGTAKPLPTGQSPLLCPGLGTVSTKSSHQGRSGTLVSKDLWVTLAIPPPHPFPSAFLVASRPSGIHWTQCQPRDSLALAHREVGMWEGLSPPQSPVFSWRVGHGSCSLLPGALWRFGLAGHPRGAQMLPATSGAPHLPRTPPPAHPGHVSRAPLSAESRRNMTSSQPADPFSPA